MKHAQRFVVHLSVCCGQYRFSAVPFRQAPRSAGLPPREFEVGRAARLCSLVAGCSFHIFIVSAGQPFWAGEGVRGPLSMSALVPTLAHILPPSLSYRSIVQRIDKRCLESPRGDRAMRQVSACSCSSMSVASRCGKPYSYITFIHRRHGLGMLIRCGGCTWRHVARAPFRHCSSARSHILTALTRQGVRQ